MTDNIRYMKRAMALAGRGSGWVNPNPMVGAVLVKDGHVIGEGFHEYFGGPHAEVNAIRSAIGNVEGATLFVTLEPCCHHGKTPPCAELIVEKKIRRVVVGMNDPNPLVNGKGIDFLRLHGIAVETGILEPELRRQSEIFVRYITTGNPFILLKTAMTLDGKIATVTNASRWITGESSRKLVHRMRQQYSAVLVGVDTVLSDDPLLNIRLRRSPAFPGGWKNPLKVIADSKARVPLTAKVLLEDPQLTIIATTRMADKNKVREIRRMGAQVVECDLLDGKVDLRHLKQLLGAMFIDSVMIEGGSTIAFSALQQGIADKVVTFIAPKLLGGTKAPTPVGGKGIRRMEEAIQLKRMNYRKIGVDIMVEGYTS